MTPLWSLAGGGCQVNDAEIVPVTKATKLCGGAVGTTGIKMNEIKERLEPLYP